MRPLLVVTLTSVVLVVGCPPSSEKKGPGGSNAPANAPCARVGQTCEVSPGKLGTCVVRDDCTGPSCFVCQSQH